MNLYEVINKYSSEINSLSFSTDSIKRDWWLFFKASEVKRTTYHTEINHFQIYDHVEFVFDKESDDWINFVSKKGNYRLDIYKKYLS